MTSPARIRLLASNLTPVILESPYAASISATTEQHLIYARRCIRHSLAQHEAPTASHLLYTQPGILLDDNLLERELGIAAGFTLYPLVARCVVYTDYGISSGMKLGMQIAEEQSIPIYRRSIGR